MVNYEVTVSIANLAYAGTLNNVFIKLVGTDGESNRMWLMSLKGPLALYRGAVSSFTVSCPVSIGKLILIELDKQRFPQFFEDSWFPAKVVVKSPEGDTYKFPIYRWINDCEVHRFREATALRAFEDENDLDTNSRLQELIQRRKYYSWHVHEKGIPHSMKAESLSSLPCEVQFSFTKKTEFLYTASTGLVELKLKGFAGSKEDWPDINADDHVFWFKQSDISDYVKKHWKEDAFFGYQFLNGVNPMLIRRCLTLPENFPVADNMVSLCGQWCLASEMQKGNIFLCDYKSLDRLKTNTIDEKEQYLMAPLVLLHKTPDDKLMPIAIQLKQTPAADNPIFYPTDSEYDWLTAKTFVRSADFNEHQLNVHLLRTHLLAEVFAVSLLRNVPMVHPLYKLLVPHTRYTLHINYLARDRLISETGVFTQFAASGGEGMMTLLKRSLASLTYSSLCIPVDIAERGLEAVPNFYYRDDGLKLWDIIHRVPSFPQLLVPHTRYTLHINYLARDRLISETGVFTQFAASGGEGMMTLLKRSLASLTYSSLCIPVDIAERGLEAVPNFYYRDDGLKLWDIIHRFVQGVLGFYYKKDAEVKEDSVLQTWISDIFEHGFLSLARTGIPQSFTTVAELVKFVTMVIFTCTGQHSAVNTGQYDYGGWMPNTPTTLRLPPPTTKGKTSEATMQHTLPNIGTTVNGMAAMWLLSQPSSDFVPLGQYLEDHFSEEIPCQLIRAFQGELQVLSAHINIRNKNLEVPYTYMDPAEVENSVAI